MGARQCASVDRESDAGGSGRPGAQAVVGAASSDPGKDVAFWHEKMRFSNASQSLFTAVLQGDKGRVTKAIRGLGDPNCCSAHGYRALQIAISCGNADLLDVLLKSGANINCHSRNAPPPLVLAAGVGDARVFELLLWHGADLTVAHEYIGETPLTRAAQRGHEKIVHLALSQGSPGFQKLLAQRARSGDGATALHLAAMDGHRGICDRLLGVGAEPSVTDRKGRMPLHHAVEGNHIETANLLLTFGSSSNMGDKDGSTPLHLAAERGSLALADLLLRYLADVNLQRVDGNTPLHLAAGAGYDVVLRLLLSQGAEPNLFNRNGEQPFALAFREGYVKICRALLEGGAEVLPVADARWEPPYTEHEPRQLVTDDTSRDVIGC